MHTDRYTARVACRDTHTPAAALVGTHTHTSLPFLAPCTHEHGMHTHTHTHTRQEPGLRRGLERGGRGGWVCGCGPSPVPPPPSPAADTPRTELCNWIEICKRNANWKTYPNPRAEGQPQIHSTFLPPPHPQTASVSRGPGRGGAGGGAELVVLPCGRGGGSPPTAGGEGVLSTHWSWAGSLAPGSRGWHRRGVGPRPRARGAQSCPCPRRRGGGPSPCRAARGGRGGGRPAGPRRC